MRVYFSHRNIQTVLQSWSLKMNTVDILGVPLKRGVRKEYHDLEIEVWKWVLAESENRGKLPTKATIQKYAQQKYSEAGHYDFKASTGWYRRWRKRYKLKESFSSVRAHTVTVETSTKAEESITPSSPLHQPNDGTNLSETLESFSIETDKLMSNIEMINSPSEFFDFTESAIDMTDTGDISMKNFMKELMDDFGRYFNESNDCVDKRNDGTGKLSKKSCKYDKDFKDKVIGFIKKHRVMEAAAQFKISPETISIWMKENKFQDQLTQICVEESTNENSVRDIQNKEREFCQWLLEKEKNNVTVSKEEVREKLITFFTPSWCGKKYWFAKYCYRYLHGKQSSKPVKINYSNLFQKLMVNYAAKTSQIRTASVFNLARKQIFNWMKSTYDTKDTNYKKQTEEKLFEWYDSKPLKPAGRVVREKAKQLLNGNAISKNAYSWYYKWCAKNNIPVKRNCDELIVEWILAAYDRNVSVSHEDVQKKALEIYGSQNEGSFKASTGWLLRFCRRYMNLLRRTPPLSATLPSACESNVEKVQREILDSLTENKINHDVYGVMDEILLKLKPGTNNNRQQKPLLRSCGTSNVQGTVILTCLSNGVILPPLLILKDKYDITNDANRFSILYQPNGTVDENVMEFWLNNIWFKYVREPNLLLADCFEPHLSENVRKNFKEHNSRLIIIPAGCSSKLNPLTQTILPQFQATIDENCCKWFEENSLMWQMGGSSASLFSEDIIDWVEKAYASVNTKFIQENVRNVFEQMGIVVKDCGSTLGT